MIDSAGKAILRRAFRMTCDELQWHHRVGPQEFRGLVDTIALALFDVYQSGQRDEGQLADHAIRVALRRAKSPVDVA
jgi:hypothetical protein